MPMKFDNDNDSVELNGLAVAAPILTKQDLRGRAEFDMAKGRAKREQAAALLGEARAGLFLKEQEIRDEKIMLVIVAMMLQLLDTGTHTIDRKDTVGQLLQRYGV